MVEEVKTYDVRASRDGKFWFIEVPEIAHATQARTVREIGEMARDLIAVTTGADPASFTIDVSFELPESVLAALSTAAELRDQAAQAKHAAAVKTRIAARELQATGMSLRDIGAVLGVSYQRAFQLVHEAPEDDQQIPA